MTTVLYLLTCDECGWRVASTSARQVCKYPKCKGIAKAK